MIDILGLSLRPQLSYLLMRGGLAEREAQTDTHTRSARLQPAPMVVRGEVGLWGGEEKQER